MSICHWHEPLRIEDEGFTRQVLDSSDEYSLVQIPLASYNRS